MENQNRSLIPPNTSIKPPNTGKKLVKLLGIGIFVATLLVLFVYSEVTLVPWCYNTLPSGICEIVFGEPMIVIE